MVPEWLQPSPFERFHPEPSSTGLGVAPGNPSALQGWCSLERCPFANQCHIPCDSFASSGSLFWPGCSHHADLGVPSTRCGQKNYLQATRFCECGGTSYKMVPISDSKCIRFFQQIPTGSVSSITSCSNQATVLDKDLSHALCMDARLLAFPTLITEPQGMGCYSIIVLGTTWDRLPHVAT